MEPPVRSSHGAPISRRLEELYLYMLKLTRYDKTGRKAPQKYTVQELLDLHRFFSVIENDGTILIWCCKGIETRLVCVTPL